ncbi:MAG: NADH-quinone oxidoreductase subunit K [Candidatus Margulisbacteria bacterium]|jgi:multisubunit Na+/H+ antiporter MnhC subunit|nr:NADH-quinone oxidoreductase subunit K [Candidatus Margulisiibacteriota bacterium]
MSAEQTLLFWQYASTGILLLVIGFYCLLVTYNLFRVLIGLELLIKGVTLFLLAAGVISGHSALSQGVIITVIVIEVVVMIVAAGIVLGFQDKFDSLNVKNARELKG